MGAVIPFISNGAVEDAWDRYAEKARELETDPRLLSDRQFNEELAKRHEKWRRLFLRSGII